MSISIANLGYENLYHEPERQIAMHYYQQMLTRQEYVDRLTQNGSVQVRGLAHIDFYKKYLENKMKEKPIGKYRPSTSAGVPANQPLSCATLKTLNSKWRAPMPQPHAQAYNNWYKSIKLPPNPKEVPKSIFPRQVQKNSDKYIKL